MTMHLMALSGPDKGRIFQLNEGCPQSVGRSHTHTEITLSDTDVARVQCQVALQGDSLVVTDLDGTSSTFVNDQVVNEHTMKPGDTLRLGQTLLRFQKEQVGKGVPPTVVPTIVVNPRPVPVAPVRAVVPARGARDNSKLPCVTPVSPSARRIPPDTAVVSSTRAEEMLAASALPSVPLPADRLNELAGTTLGHFELGPVFGEGHTGAVFKARDAKALRTVAIRVLPAEFPKNDAERQRFIQAVKEMLHLDYVHLVKLYGAGKANAYHWLASEFVEGPNLSQIMKQGRPSAASIAEPLRAWEPAYRIAVHISRALEYAHKHYFIHRNITPADILVAGDIATNDCVAKLNDLVMFKALEGSGLRQVSLRAKVATDLAYFSPEQTYSGAPVDARSDIFSLGSVVYAVLMGRPPFDAPSQAETVRRIREEPPVSPRKLHPLLPRLFDSILLKMLAKPPEHRFQTATELLAALDQIRHHQD
jgi:pSer/pThr/pTyr-binding forkhead associated (FHA) protein